MKKRISALILALIIAVAATALTSCSGKSEYPVTAAGITLNEEPEKIIILNKNYTDIISCIGYASKLVGRSDSVNQKGMDVVPSVGGAAEPSLEKIKKLKPDLVIADNSLSSAVKDKLTKSGITLLIPEQANTPKQIKNLYTQFGTLLGGNITGKPKGQKAFNDLYESLNSVQDAVEEKDIKKTVCYLYNENGVLKAVTNSTWCSAMLDFTGATNVFKNEKSDKVNLKKLILMNPDYIFCDNKDVIKPLKKGATLKKLSALHDTKKRYVIPMDELSMQGDTSLEALKDMLKKMYPEDFE